MGNRLDVRHPKHLQKKVRRLLLPEEMRRLRTRFYVRLEYMAVTVSLYILI